MDIRFTTEAYALLGYGSWIKRITFYKLSKHYLPDPGDDHTCHRCNVLLYVLWTKIHHATVPLAPSLCFNRNFLSSTDILYFKLESTHIEITTMCNIYVCVVCYCKDNILQKSEIMSQMNQSYREFQNM